MAGESSHHVSPIMPEDLATLAAQVVEGLRAHLAGDLQLCLGELFREQEQRLLAALVPVPECRNPAHARILGPARRLHTGSSANSTPMSTSRNFPWPSENIAGTRMPTADDDVRLEPRSTSKKSQGQCSLTASRKSPRWPPELAGSGLKHNEPEKHWLKLPWQYLSSDAAPAVPSGVRSLGEARDSELLGVVPNIQGQCQLQPPSRVSSSSNLMLEKWTGEQFSSFSGDKDLADLPGVVCTPGLDLERSLDGDQLDEAYGPEEQASGAAAVAMDNEFHPRGGLLSGHTANEAVTASASDAGSVCQFTYEEFAAILKHNGDLPSKPAAAATEGCFLRNATMHCHQPRGSQGDCTPGTTPIAASGAKYQSMAPDAHRPACSPRQRPSALIATTLEHSWEAGAPWLRREGTAQSISTMSSNVSMMSSSTLLDAASTKCVHERACTGESNMVPARRSSLRQLNARSFASDTRAARPKREQASLGESSKVQERTIVSDRKGETTKPGSRRLSAKTYCSDTKAMRLSREEELLHGIGRRNTEGQDGMPSKLAKLCIHRTLQARCFASDSKVMRLKCQEELVDETSKPSTRHRQASEPSDPTLNRSLSPRSRSSENLPGGMRRSRLRHRQNSKARRQVTSPERIIQPARPAFHRTCEAEALATDTQRTFWKQREAEPVFLSEGMQTVVEENSRLLSPCTPRAGEADHALVHHRCVGQRMDSPLLLRLCGLLPLRRFWAVHRCVVLLLAAGLVAIFVEQFYQGQSRIMSTTDCHYGICMHFGHLSDLVLSMGSFLGILALRTLASQNLLGSPTALLTRFAIEQDVVQNWSCASSRNSLYLAILWVGSLSFRAATMPSGRCWMDVVQACAFVLTSLIFMGLVFSILHVSCLICILIDNYALRVDTTNPVRSIREWDKLGALLRNASRAVDRGFLLVQTTAMAMLLSSFADLMLQGGEQIWCFLSNMLLAQSIILSLSKAAEATEMCTRLPSLINSMDFGGDEFSLERHYLVEHISYSAAGFYVGEVRLTAAIALRGVYISVVIALGVLTKLTQITTL